MFVVLFMPYLWVFDNINNILIIRKFNIKEKFILIINKNAIKREGLFLLMIILYKKFWINILFY